MKISKRSAMLLFSTCLSSLCLLGHTHHNSTNDWENPQIVGQNKEAPHATLYPFEKIENAIKNDPTKSPYFKLLNGTWKFNWVRKPADRPVDFFRLPNENPYYGLGNAIKIQQRTAAPPETTFRG